MALMGLTPADFIASWSEDETDVTFPIASVPELSAAEADGATGDMREVILALLEQIWTTLQAEAAADRPTNMTMYRNVVVNADDTSTRQYVLTFTCDAPSAGTIVVTDES